MALTLLGCGDDRPAAPADPTTTSPGSTGVATGDGTSEGSGTGAVPACPTLFGRPTAASGLSDTMCAPSCPCIGLDAAPTYDEAAIEAMLTLTLLDPPSTPVEDPYADPSALPPELPPNDSSTVCAVRVEGDDYRLATYADAAAAERASAVVTHGGACGLCSPLADLAVYMRNNDLTEPVRACGLLGVTEGVDANRQCLRELGFTEPCAEIWLYNTLHTRTECAAECFAALDEPYHLPDGSLNACLSCDEARSGPVFKAVAGRTRRNTGLPSALCRPCQDVRLLTHVYR